jgi:hypothetical protein
MSGENPFRDFREIAGEFTDTSGIDKSHVEQWIHDDDGGAPCSDIHEWIEVTVGVDSSAGEIEDSYRGGVVGGGHDDSVIACLHGDARVSKDIEGRGSIGGEDDVEKGQEPHQGDQERGESRPSRDANAPQAKPPSALVWCHVPLILVWNTGFIMNILLVVLCSALFLASFPMFTYSFVVPEVFAPWLFAAGILTACLAFAIPIVVAGRRR